jgi:hypothetical protein
LSDYNSALNFTLTGFGNIQVYHLKEGVERFLITDINNPAGSSAAQSQIPVMWDFFATADGDSAMSPSNFAHAPGGLNVLGMDGHVEFVKYRQPDGTSGLGMIATKGFANAVNNY